MKKLHADYLDRRDELARLLNEAATKVEAKLAVTAAQFKAVVESLSKDVQPEVDAYNKILADCRHLAKDARSTVQEYFDEKSESWQSGKTGRRYEAWIGELDNLTFDDLEIEDPEEPEWLDSELNCGLDCEAIGTLEEFPDALPD